MVNWFSDDRTRRNEQTVSCWHLFYKREENGVRYIDDDEDNKDGFLLPHWILSINVPAF